MFLCTLLSGGWGGVGHRIKRPRKGHSLPLLPSASTKLSNALRIFIMWTRNWAVMWHVVLRGGWCSFRASAHWHLYLQDAQILWLKHGDYALVTWKVHQIELWKGGEGTCTTVHCGQDAWASLSKKRELLQKNSSHNRSWGQTQS